MNVKVSPRTRGIALRAISSANGLYEPSFGSRIPQLQLLLGLTVGGVGAVLTAFPLGLLGGSIITAIITRRLGTRLPLIAGSVLCFGPLIFIALALGSGHTQATAVVMVTIGWGIAGVGCGMLDPAHAVCVAAYSKEQGKLHGQGFLAVKMAATAAGAIFGALAIAYDVPVAKHFLVIGVLALVLSLSAALVLPNVRNRPTREERGPDVGLGGITRLALLAAGSAVPLGLAVNWGTSLLTELDAPRYLVGSGLVGFALAQAVGLGASRLASSRMRTERMVTLGILVATGGIGGLAAVAANGWLPFLPSSLTIAITVASLVALGLGIAPISGLAQQAAYMVRAQGLKPSTRVTVIISLQYGAMMGAPAFMGFIGDQIGVVAAFVLVTAVCVIPLLSMCNILEHAAVAHRPAPKPSG